jgi:hypothetical protein
MSKINGVLRASPILMRRFKVVEIHDDYLVCRAFDGLVFSAELERVAKPWDLQRTAHDGRTYVMGDPPTAVTYAYAGSAGLDPHRSATRGASVTGERITPAYFVEAQVLALFLPLGGTGVSASGVEVQWLDLNVGARGWAVV